MLSLFSKHLLCYRRSPNDQKPDNYKKRLEEHNEKVNNFIANYGDPDVDELITGAETSIVAATLLNPDFEVTPEWFNSQWAPFCKYCLQTAKASHFNLNRPLEALNASVTAYNRFVDDFQRFLVRGDQELITYLRQYCKNNKVQW